MSLDGGYGTEVLARKVPLDMTSTPSNPIIDPKGSVEGL